MEKCLPSKKMSKSKLYKQNKEKINSFNCKTHSYFCKILSLNSEFVLDEYFTGKQFKEYTNKYKELYKNSNDIVILNTRKNIQSFKEVNAKETEQNILNKVMTTEKNIVIPIKSCSESYNLKFDKNKSKKIIASVASNKSIINNRNKNYCATDHFLYTNEDSDKDDKEYFTEGKSHSKKFFKKKQPHGNSIDNIYKTSIKILEENEETNKTRKRSASFDNRIFCKSIRKQFISTELDVSISMCSVKDLDLHIEHEINKENEKAKANNKKDTIINSPERSKFYNDKNKTKETTFENAIQIKDRRAHFDKDIQIIDVVSWKKYTKRMTYVAKDVVYKSSCSCSCDFPSFCTFF